MSEHKLAIIIMAKKNSTRIPDKNFKPLNNLRLVHYTMIAALKSKLAYGNTYVSTDKEGFFAGDTYKGVKIHKRKTDTDSETSAQMALINILDDIEKTEGKTFKDVIMLMPTNPFRTGEVIRNCYNQYKLDDNVKSLVTINKLTENIHWTLPLNNNISKRSQDLPDKYALNGAVFISSVSELKKYKTFYRDDTMYFCTNYIESFDIDTEEDWHIAEVLAKGLGK